MNTITQLTAKEVKSLKDLTVKKLIELGKAKFDLTIAEGTIKKTAIEMIMQENDKAKVSETPKAAPIKLTDAIKKADLGKAEVEGEEVAKAEEKKAEATKKPNALLKGIRMRCIDFFKQLDNIGKDFVYCSSNVKWRYIMVIENEAAIAEKVEKDLPMACQAYGISDEHQAIIKNGILGSAAVKARLRQTALDGTSTAPLFIQYSDIAKRVWQGVSETQTTDSNFEIRPIEAPIAAEVVAENVK
jgi:hypothetical protein